MLIDNHECFLGDNGTLDTVVIIDGKEYVFNHEYASQFRDTDGTMSEKGFIELCEQEIEFIESYLD